MYKHVKTDPELCIGCKTCVAACVVSHTGRALFALQPDSYDFTPRVHVVFTPTLTKAVQCQQCAKPLCLEACPYHCISLGKETVVIDEDACHGCTKCAQACPFDAIIMTKIRHGKTHGRPFRIVAYKCDLCQHTVTRQPACIPACPTEALSLFDPQARANAKAKRQAVKAARREERAYKKTLREGQENSQLPTTEVAGLQLG